MLPSKQQDTISIENPLMDMDEQQVDDSDHKQNEDISGDISQDNDGKEDEKALEEFETTEPEGMSVWFIFHNCIRI